MRLRASGLAYAYGAHTVLTDVSLELDAGRVLCVIGPNGSGKSTLLRCLYGALRPDSGRVWLDGAELEALDRREIARRVAVVPQQCHPAFPVSVEAFVGLGRFAHERLLRRPTRRDREVVAESLAAVGLARCRGRSIAELSGGEFRRVLFAQALAQEPRTLLLDEPLQQLDPRHQLDVLDLLRAFARAGGAVLVVLHDLALAARYGDELCLLHAGRMLARGPAERVLTHEHVERAFEVRARIERDPRTGALHVQPLAPCAGPVHPVTPTP